MGNNHPYSEGFPLEDVYKWDTETTCHWIHKIYLNELHSVYQFSNKELERLIEHVMIHNIDGNILLKLDQHKYLNELGVERENHRRMLIDVVNLIKTGRKNMFLNHSVAVKSEYVLESDHTDIDEVEIARGRFFVQQKLLQAGIMANSENDVSVAEILSSKELLLQSFMSIANEKNKKSLEDLLDAVVNNSNDNEEILDINEIFQSTQEELSQQNELENEYLSVKLVIVEQNQIGHRILQRISPLLSKINAAPEFGSFHAALIVGSWYFDWTTSSLVIPRKCYSNASVIAIELGKVFDIIDSEDMDIGFDVQVITPLDKREIFSKIAEAIVYWNTTQTYSLTNNCHHFVRDLCDRLNLTLEFSGLLGSYMNNLKKNGQCSIALDLTAHAVLRDVLQRDEIYFKSHKELDTFVRKYQKYLTNDDMLLLKSFDLAFWLRHFANPSNELYFPCDCYWQDLTIKGSILSSMSYKSQAME
jgi:DNA-directed RNA polymerase subunit N (RpoN/RPB10)